MITQNYAKEWKKNAFGVMDKIEATQMENIRKVAEVMADTIQAGRWVHTFGCGHANLPIEEMYPRIGGFVGFHPLCEIPLTTSSGKWASTSSSGSNGQKATARAS